LCQILYAAILNLLPATSRVTSPRPYSYTTESLNCPL